MKVLSFVPLYAGLSVLLLMAVMFIADRDTPRLVFVLLMGMYLGLLIFYWRQSGQAQPTVKVASLEDNSKSNKRPAVLASFQAEAQSILRQLKMQSAPRINQMQYFSPYSRVRSHPMSLSDITASHSDYQDETSIFSNYNYLAWRQQFRLAQEQFRANLEVDIANSDIYVNVLTRLGLNTDRLTDVEALVDGFLRDRCAQYCSSALKIVSEVNRILSRNFGISITKVPSTNTRQIGMDQFSKMLAYYKNNHALPSNYKKSNPSLNSSIGSLDFNMNKQSTSKLEQDMEQLQNYYKILQPMMAFPLEKFNFGMLVYILKIDFNKENIEVNSQAQKTSNMVDSFMRSSFRDSNTSVFAVQFDNWVSIQKAPEFRTKNCKKICLVFLLLLMKREGSPVHPLLHSLRRYLK